MECQVVAVVVAAVAIQCQVVAGCNARQLNDIIRNRFMQEVASDCGNEGDKCKFDQDCCMGFECKMSASAMELDNVCQRGNLATTTQDSRADTNLDIELESTHANQPSSNQDGYWMIAKSWLSDESHSSDEEGRKKRPTDTLGEIDELQEKKRRKLLKEHEELQRLFTKKDEKELETLRALKEDAEMDELRTLKELRLKRKLKLMKELRELRGLKAEENLDTLYSIMNKTHHTTEETAISKPLDSSKNTIGEDEYTSSGKTGDALTETLPGDATSQESVNGTEEFEHNQPSEGTQKSVQSQDSDHTPTRHKQGIHEPRHRRRHHQQRHRKKPVEQISGNETAPNEINQAAPTNMQGGGEIATNTE